GRDLDRDDPDALLALRRKLEPDLAGDRREDGVVVPEPGTLAGQEGHAALADDDRAGRDEPGVAACDAEALAGAVAAVRRGAAGLLVGHLVYSSFFVAPGRLGLSAAAFASLEAALAGAFVVFFVAEAFAAAALAGGSALYA